MLTRPIRILHFIGDLGGGDGLWLRHVLRNTDRARFEMDLLVARHQTHTFDEQYLAHGARIIAGAHPPNLEGVCLNFREIVRQHGPYDIFHSHANYSGGFTLRSAYHAGIPVRIAHSHLDTRVANVGRGLIQGLYQSLMDSWVQKYATAGIGVSREAAAALFGQNWEQDDRWQIVHCGRDFSPFTKTVDRAVIREELGIPEDVFVVGHVGRFHRQKNHRFFISIAREIVCREPNAHFLLVGDGALRSTIEGIVTELGLGHRFVFTGTRDDVPLLMLGAMDAFLFPSRYEGLGIALLEAQAAGLPYVCSDAVPVEADVVSRLGRRLPLSASPRVWAEAVLQAQDAGHMLTQGRALQTMEASDFNLTTGILKLVKLYERLLRGASHEH